MPVFGLDEELVFPHPVLREHDGLLAVGGDLSPARLMLAYSWGIFPWYYDDQPILWWWTAPRPMIRPSEIRITDSMRSFERKTNLTITRNTCFEKVMVQCASIPRRRQEGGTWITDDMRNAYVALHHLGLAHSIEVWNEDQLVGGLYGVISGKIFGGESMFAHQSNASKLAFMYLGRWLISEGIEWIDCQQDTPHLRTLGSQLIGEEEYLQLLRANLVEGLKS